MKYVAVNPENRIDYGFASGKVDLECGSTTNNLERQKRVAFSPVIFVSRHQADGQAAGHDPLVPRPQGQDRRGDRRARPTRPAMKALSDKQKLGHALRGREGPRPGVHAASRRPGPTPSRPTTCCSTA